MSDISIDRCGYIVRPFLGYFQIINKETKVRQNIAIRPPRSSRCHMILKHDHDALYDIHDAQQWAISILHCWDDINFTALCAHFTGGRNYFDR